MTDALGRDQRRGQDETLERASTAFRYAKKHRRTHRMAETEPRTRAVGLQHRPNEGDQIAFEVGKVVDVPLCGCSASGRSEPPWPRQSIAATANPRDSSSSTTSKYFSMNSPRPPRTATLPREGDVDAQRAVRNRTPSAARISSSMPFGGAGLSSVDVKAIDAVVSEGRAEMKLGVASV